MSLGVPSLAGCSCLDVSGISLFSDYITRLLFLCPCVFYAAHRPYRGSGRLYVHVCMCVWACVYVCVDLLLFVSLGMGVLFVFEWKVGQQARPRSRVPSCQPHN